MSSPQSNVVYFKAPNNADKFMFRLEGCIKDIEFSRAIDELLPPFLLKKKIGLIKMVFDEVTKSYGEASWRWVVIVQWIRDMSVLIKSAWAREEKAGIEIGQTAISVLKSITSELDSLYAIVEANVICDPVVQSFHDDCVMSGCLDGTLMHGVARPPPLLDEGDDDKDDDECDPAEQAYEPSAKRSNIVKAEEENAGSHFIGGGKDEKDEEGDDVDEDAETQEPPAYTPLNSPPHQAVCPAAPQRAKPVVRVQEVTVIDDEKTYTTFTINFHPTH